jgi:glucan phosphoethanolaminetransferase (alkaline phosphatase superfamily)
MRPRQTTHGLRRLPARREARGLLLLAALHLALSGAAGVYFYLYLRRGYSLLLLHPLLAVTALALLLLSGGALPDRVRRRRATRAVAALLLTAWSCLLLLLYAGNYITNRFWGSNVFYGLVVGYAQSFYTTLKLVFPHAHLLLAAGGALFSGVFAAYLKFSGRLLDEARGVGRWLFGDRRARVMSLAALFTCAALFTSLFWTRYRFALRQREIIISFLNTPPIFPETPRRLAAVAADGEARRQYAAPASFRRRNVILITVDCLRADHLSVYGYRRDTTPFLAELDEAGRLWRAKLAAATCPNSACGLLSTLASKPAAELTRGNFKLPDLLRDRGYRVNLILSNAHSFWYDLRRHYGDGVDFYFDGSMSRRYLPTDDRVLFEGLERLPDFDGTPAFFYFHLMSAHNFGIRYEPRPRFLPARRLAPPWPDGDPAVIEQFTNDYDNGVTQADAVIRQLFAELRRKGYLAGSLAVILGDHGQALGERGEYSHDSSLYQAQLGIPVMIYDEPGAAYRGLDFARQIDVAPTVVDRLGLPIPPTWRGHSLLDPGGRRVSYHEVRPGMVEGVIEAGEGAVYKYLRSPAEGREELYELRSDPGETRNLIQTAPAEVVERLRGEWGRGFAEAP